jgi:hypothetical protein
MDVHAQEMARQLRLINMGVSARADGKTVFMCPWPDGHEDGYWWRRGWHQEDYDLKILAVDEKTFDVDYEYDMEEP